MKLFQDTIFDDYYTDYDKRTDPNKDQDHRGTVERINRTFGNTYDVEVVPLIDNMQDNLINPNTVLDRFIPYLESMLGYRVNWYMFFDQTPVNRRSFIKIIVSLYKIRGTRRCIDLMFSWLNFTSVTVTEIDPPEGGFDSSDTFDSPVRTFDSGCPTCSNYTIEIVGVAVSLTMDQIRAIYTIIVFNQPINADLTLLTYNGVAIDITLISNYSQEYSNEYF